MPSQTVFSVIIPVYNVEQYLDECVRSVLSQTLKDIEVILVNDGSTDSCPQICDSYADEDARVKVIHKENGGLGRARNDGIKNAFGDYIIFLDSDDYWDDENALSEIHDIIVKYGNDVVIFGVKKLESGIIDDFLHDFDEITNEELRPFDNTERLKRIIAARRYLTYSVNKVVSRKLFLSNNLYFEEIENSHDNEWCGRVAIVSKNIAYYANDFYIYRLRTDSMSSTTSEVKARNYKTQVLKLCRLVLSIDDISLREALIPYARERYWWMTRYLDDCGLLKQYYSEIKKVLPIFYCNYSLTRKQALQARISKIFGLRFTIKLTKLYESRKHWFKQTV